MKKLTLLILLISSSVFSQSHNFSLKNESLIWSKVFNDTITPENTFKALKQNSDFIYLDLLDNVITFDLNYQLANLEKYGYNVSSFPTYVFFDSNCKGIIKFKEGRYKVEINKLNVSNLNFATAIQQTFLIDNYTIKKGKLKESKSNLKVFNTFNKYFTTTFSKFKTEQEEDW